jgi:hypothetical protein
MQINTQVNTEQVQYENTPRSAEEVREERRRVSGEEEKKGGGRG